MNAWAYILRILLAAALSAVVGIEREFHGRPAGLRTHLLVGSGAALVIVALQVAWTAVLGGEGAASELPAEIGRLAAGVITGIGFLGAGTIIKVGDWVRGLTTAASLWFVSMVGIAAGLGAWQIALAGGAIALLILAVVDPLASRIPSRMYQTLRLSVERKQQQQVQDQLAAYCLSERTRATLVSWESDAAEDLVTLTYRVRHRGSPDLHRVADQASSLEGVVRVRIGT